METLKVSHGMDAFSDVNTPRHSFLDITMDEKSSSKRSKTKHEKHKDSDPDRKHKKRAREDEEGKGSRKKHKHRKSEKGKERDKKGEHKVEIVDDDPNDEGMWVEKDITMDGERVRNYLFMFDVSSLLIFLGPCS